MKICVISNCQALPISLAWKAMRPHDDMFYAEVHSLIGKQEE